MAVQIQLRRDTAANWTSANPTLAAGEVGIETDTGKLKIGTGATAWNSLAYGPAGAAGAAALGDLSDVASATPTDKHVLIGNGLVFGTRALVSTDISDFSALAVVQDGFVVGNADGSAYESQGPAAARATMGMAAMGIQIWEPAPAAGTVVLLQYAPYPFTINSLVRKTESGSVQASVQINGTNVTGLAALTADSTERTTNATAANTVAVGDTVTMVLASPSSPVNLSMTLLGTR